MDLDRQAIERRDFPIGRRGYETAAVDAHLRGLAGEFEQLQRASAADAAPLASSASAHVQGIVEAAEAAAAEIERHAQDEARETRAAADRDAAATREQAIAKARAHAAAVAEATAALQERIAALDAEVGVLVESVRGATTRLASDLTAIDTQMPALYDAAALGGPPPPPSDASTPEPAPEPSAASEPPAAPEPPAPPPAAPKTPGLASPEPAAGDVDGARLVALNMALNGESRADTERYLEQNFELSDRAALVAQVYAAVEA